MRCLRQQQEVQAQAGGRGTQWACRNDDRLVGHPRHAEGISRSGL